MPLESWVISKYIPVVPFFKKYVINHIEDTSSGYERVASIQEYNSHSEPANPVVFEYNTSEDTTNRIEKTYNNNLNFSTVDVAGDSDGDGRLDFVAGDKVFTNLFNGNSGNDPITWPFSIDYNSPAKSFAITTLKDNKLSQHNSILNIEQGRQYQFQCF